MSVEQLHKTQVSILRSLRYAKSSRFNELMRPTGHTSDTFKFHVRKLIKLGYVTKLDTGKYMLTPSGKEYSNSLNEPKRTIEKQPKLSVLILAQKQENGTTKYLLQKRARNPFFGYWNEITGRVRWGESFEYAAGRELERQTGLSADFKVCGIRRIRDYKDNDETLLEDKLFVIMEAANISGELTNRYAGGTNTWLSLDQIVKDEKHFASTPEIIRAYQDKQFYATQSLSYTEGEY